MQKTNDTPPPRTEEIINWTLPGATMYYRDSNLSQAVIDKYAVGKILRSPTFVDVANYAGKPTTNCRFVFASSKAAPLYRVNPAMEKWGLHVMNCNSCFKVLDVYRNFGLTQVFLLHIPYRGIGLFSGTVLKIGGQDVEERIIGRARASLDQKMKQEVPPALNEKEWLERTHFPIGLDHQNEFFEVETTEPLPPAVGPLHAAIRKMTNDLTDLNETVPAG